MKIRIIVLAAFLLLMTVAGCAGYRPMVDLSSSSGKTQATYEQDLKQCQEYAKQVSPDTSAAMGAGAGAAFGALVGGVAAAVLGADVGENILLGASMGGISGGVGGVGAGANTQMEVIKRCMQGRGYTVLK